MSSRDFLRVEPRRVGLQRRYRRESVLTTEKGAVAQKISCGRMAVSAVTAFSSRPLFATRPVPPMRPEVHGIRDKKIFAWHLARVNHRWSEIRSPIDRLVLASATVARSTENPSGIRRAIDRLSKSTFVNRSRLPRRITCKRAATTAYNNIRGWLGLKRRTSGPPPDHPNLFDRGNPLGATRPASARLPRQSASSFMLRVNARPAESVHDSPWPASKVLMSDRPPSL